jgi:hypothetical protein
MLSNNIHYSEHHRQNIYDNQENCGYNSLRSAARDKKKRLRQAIEKQDDIGFGFTFLSLLSHVTDLVLQVTLVYLFYYEPNRLWFKLTASLLIIPSLIINLFSLKW